QRVAQPPQPSARTDTRREPQGIQQMIHASASRLLPALAWLLLSLSLLLAVWWLAAARIGNPVLLPGPALVATGLAELLGGRTLFDDIAASLKRVFIGFFIASALAIPLALVMAY